MALGQGIVADTSRLLTRFALWWQGVQAGGAAQDGVVFAAFAGLLFWTSGVLTAWLARRYEGGLVAATPSLWLVGVVMLYSPPARTLLIVGILLAVILHVLLDQGRLIRRWQAAGLDFSPGLFVDRLLAVGAIVALLLTVAALLPNLSIEALAWRYYQWTEPWQARVEAAGDRLFPDLAGVSRLQGGGVAGGLPNDFLLGNSPALGESVVMRIRTDDFVDFADSGGPFYEQPPPPGYYTRGATFALYDGQGWSNPPNLQRQDFDANTAWQASPPKGRRRLVQSVTLTFNSSILYGAPEQIEPGLAYAAETRADGDLVALWARERNYTVVSAIPAVSEQQLAAEPGWGDEQPLPAGYEIHLQLPETITERTRLLGGELTANQPNAYAKAHAIETYLRTIEYDLNVPEPPDGVADVVDYFLFDLQRGYCDYYATAFVALARLAGLPTRFATGYAVGRWNEIERIWIITEAEAHSWPEVYFPQYGWIPFEPTAGRAELTRIGLPDANGASAAPAPSISAETETPQTAWNWQLLFWLAPLALLAWTIFTLLRRWQNGRQDPWQALLRWGQRAGRPMASGETVLQYGAGLVQHIRQRQPQEADTGRVVIREVTALSEAVTALRYGPEPSRAAASVRVGVHWQRLRSYLERLRWR